MKRYRIYIAISMALSIVLQSVTTALAAKEYPITLLDEATGEPLQAANVTIGGETFTSNEAGRIFVSLPDGVYDVTALANDGWKYMPKEQKATVNSTWKNGQNLKLSKTVQVQILVVDSKNQPIPDAAVAIYDNANFQGTPVFKSKEGTGADGMVFYKTQMGDLQPGGSYWIRTAAGESYAPGTFAHSAQQFTVQSSSEMIKLVMYHPEESTMQNAPSFKEAFLEGQRVRILFDSPIYTEKGLEKEFLSPVDTASFTLQDSNGTSLLITSALLQSNQVLLTYTGGTPSAVSFSPLASSLREKGNADIRPMAFTDRPLKKEKQIDPTVKALGNEMLTLVNKEREQEGLGVLAYDDALSSMAQLKADDMFINNTWSHYSPRYGFIENQMDLFYSGKSKYDSPMFENFIAYPISKESNIDEVAKGLFQTWLKDEKFYITLMNENNTRFGLAFCNGYWVQISGRLLGEASIKVHADTEGDGGTAFVRYDASGMHVTFVAQPEAGYQFQGWYEGETEVSKEANFTIALKEDKMLTARFVSSSIPIALEVQTVDEQGKPFKDTGGEVMLADDLGQKLQAMDPEKSAILYARAYDGFTFAGWFESSNMEQPVSTEPIYILPEQKSGSFVGKFIKLDSDSPDPQSNNAVVSKEDSTLNEQSEEEEATAKTDTVLPNLSKEQSKRKGAMRAYTP